MEVLMTLYLLTSTNFYGFGYNTGILRYQTPGLGNIHRFLCGTTAALSLNEASASFSGNITSPNITVDTGGTLTTSNFTVRAGGTVNGLTASMVGLGNVNNTSDSSKTFLQSQITGLVSALAEKAPTTSSTFTGNPLIQNTTGDSVLLIKTNDTTSNPSVLFTSNITPNINNGRLMLYPSGVLEYRQITTVAQSLFSSAQVGFQVLPNGVFSTSNKTFNKLLVLNDNNSSDDPRTATNFYGFGYNTGIIRYQTPFSGNSHRFYCGSTQALLLSDAFS